MPKYPPLTLALIATCLSVYIMMALAREFDFGVGFVDAMLISNYSAGTLPEVVAGQWWRIITPIFIHFGVFHILFNVCWLWEFGRLIEWRQNTLILALLTLITGVAANLAQYFATGPLFGGMSGVLFGYFGYLWMQGLVNPRFGIRLKSSITMLFFVWFALCWSGVFEFFGLQVANVAHTTGLVSGMLFALASYVPGPSRR